MRVAGWSGTGAGAPSGAWRRHSMGNRCHDHQQDVRLGHEGDDVRPRSHHGGRAGRRRRGRIGEHDQCAIPDGQGAGRDAHGPRQGLGSHVPRWPGGRLRAGPSDGHLCRGHGAALSVHARIAGRVCHYVAETRQDRQRGWLVRPRARTGNRQNPKGGEGRRSRRATVQRRPLEDPEPQARFRQGRNGDAGQFELDLRRARLRLS